MKIRFPRYLIWSVPLILIVGVITFVRMRPVEVEGRPVTTGEVVEEILGIGTLESAREVRVTFEVSGRVTSLAVDEGAMVAEGDLLGTLDVYDAEQDLAVARATERAAASAVERARAELDRGRLAAVRAASDRARSDALFASGVVHALDHDAAVERDEGARADVRRLESALRQAEGTASAASHGTRVRASQVADGRLVSPLAGLVTKRVVEAGQLVSPGSPAFTIVATDALRVSAWVDETALGRLEIGQPARLVFRSEGDRSFPGRVERIGREVDRQTHEMIVDVGVFEPPRNFAIGQRADAWIQVDRRDAVARVPRGWGGENSLVVTGGRARVRSVTTGIEGREFVEVVSGVSPGDIVLAPGSAKDGKRVRVQENP